MGYFVLMSIEKEQNHKTYCYVHFDTHTHVRTNAHTYTHTLTHECTHTHAHARMHTVPAKINEVKFVSLL